MLGRVEHARWKAERILAGWTYAPGRKDIARKTSPYIVEWDKLSPEVQQYDRDFVTLIPALLDGDAQKICRQEPPTDL
jgi:hypothetical protein